MLRALSKHWRLLQRAQHVKEALPCSSRSFAEAAVETVPETGETPESHVAEGIATAAQAAEELPTIAAIWREASGTTLTNRLRKTGNTPSILFSLPGNQSQLLSVNSKEIEQLVRTYGRSGIQSKVFNLEVQPAEGAPPQTYRVLPRLLHVNAVTDVVENVTFMHMPPERRAVVSVPIKVTGEDLSPGIKRGAWVNITERRVKVSCPGSNVPPFIEVDVSSMDINQSLRLGELAEMLPEGLQLIAKDMRHPVFKITGGKRAVDTTEESAA